ncbi:MAG: tyrosine-type recombinase/integrase [Gammaproteobacteria bacterium]|nr:tyrosine-type recombinase/integrase [Gammaproteobacteria bacterium]
MNTYLTPHEIERCLIAAKQTGQPKLRQRNYALLLLMYRHALRASEIIALRWSQIDFQQGLLHVNRLKHGIPANHPLRGPELRTLKALQRHYPITPYVFTSQRKTPLAARTVH